jgi:hypothetical protein
MNAQKVFGFCSFVQKNKTELPTDNHSKDVALVGRNLTVFYCYTALFVGIGWRIGTFGHAGMQFRGKSAPVFTEKRGWTDLDDVKLSW